MVPTGANYFIMKLMHPPTSLSVIAMAALLLLLYPSCMTSSTTPSMTMTAMAFITPAVRIQPINPTHSQHLPLSPSPRCTVFSTYHPRSASSSLPFAPAVASCRRQYSHSSYGWARHMSEQPPDDEGADLAAQFFKALSERNISLDKDELDEDDDEEEEDDDEEYYDDDETNSGEGDDADDAILREYDVPTTEEGMMELTDTQIYDDLKDRVLESAGAFVELASLSVDEDEGLVVGGDILGEEEDDGVYHPPTNVPDSGLTAGEVVELVLAGLRNNDIPRPDYGIEILFGYSSPGSYIHEQLESGTLTPSQYRAFLLSSGDDNAALFTHGSVIIDKAELSPDGLKGYFTARLMPSSTSGMETGGVGEGVAVNFILSTTGTNDDDCWLIDSMLIRPSKLRRRRGRR